MATLKLSELPIVPAGGAEDRDSIPLINFNGTTFSTQRVSLEEIGRNRGGNATKVVTSDSALVSGDNVIAVVGQSADLLLTLPAAPVVGDRIEILVRNSSTRRVLRLDLSSQKLEGATPTAPYSVSSPRCLLLFKYVSTGQGWLVHSRNTDSLLGSGSNQRFSNVVLYTGSGVATSLTGQNFQPDLAIIKDRANVRDWQFLDFVRGSTRVLTSNPTAAAETTVADGLTAFNADGITLRTNAAYNGAGTNYWAALFRRGGACGFDIASYVGTAAVQSVFHNLGGVPEFILFKSRTALNWGAYHVGSSAVPETGFLQFNSTAALATSAAFSNTAPSSTAFSLGADATINASGANYVAYLWRSIEGVSRFTSYTGNGSATGPIVTLGFQPQMIWIKNVSAVGDWVVLDTLRSPSDPRQVSLVLNTTAAEVNQPNHAINLLSDGFQLATANAAVNAAGNRYIVCAWA